MSLRFSDRAAVMFALINLRCLTSIPDLLLAMQADIPRCIAARKDTRFGRAHHKRFAVTNANRDDLGEMPTPYTGHEMEYDDLTTALGHGCFRKSPSNPT